MTPERALLLVGPQYTAERRSVTANFNRSLEDIRPLGIGIVASFLKQAGIENLQLRVMQPGKMPWLEADMENSAVVFVSSRFFDAAMTRQAIDLAGKCKVPIVVGGYGPSLVPQIYEGASIVRGEAESVLPEMIEDLKSRPLKAVYDARGKPFDISTKYVHPDRSIFPTINGLGAHFHRFPIEIQRGCSNLCTFCSPVRIQGSPIIRARQIGDVLAEIDHDPYFSHPRSGRFLFAVDLNTTALDKEYLKELFAQLLKRRIRWGMEGTVQPLLSDFEEQDKETSLLSQMRGRKDSGCWSFLYGADDLDPPQGRVAGSRDKELSILGKTIHLFRQFRIPLNLSVVVGLDHHTFPETFYTIARILEEVQPAYTFLHIATPYQGTPWGDKVLHQGRIIDTDPIHYSHNRVVFKPARMTPHELQQGYFWLRRTLYSPRQILQTTTNNFDLRAFQEHLFLGSLLIGAPWTWITWAIVKERGRRGALDWNMQKELDINYRLFSRPKLYSPKIWVNT